VYSDSVTKLKATGRRQSISVQSTKVYFCKDSVKKKVHVCTEGFNTNRRTFLHK
jgi:ribosomal protein L28